MKAEQIPPKASLNQGRLPVVALGTPAYMPPEQASGNAHDADQVSDVYSLGVILYELLVGVRPFRGNRQMLISQVLHDEPIPPRRLDSTIPKDLETICLKCMEKSRDRRYSSAKALAEDLDSWTHLRPIAAQPISTTRRVFKWVQRNQRVAILCGLLAASLLVGFVLSSFFAVQSYGRNVNLRKAFNVLTAEKVRADGESRRAARAESAERRLRLDAESQLRKSNAARLAAQSLGTDPALPIRRLLLSVKAVEETKQHAEGVLTVARESLVTALANIGGRRVGSVSGSNQELSFRGSTLIARPKTPDIYQFLDRIPKLWTIEGSSFTRLPEVTPQVHDACVTADGRFLVTRDVNGRKVRLWDRAARPPSETELVFNEPVTAFCFAPDEQFLVVAAYDGTIHFRRVEQGGISNVSSKTIATPQDEIIEIEISPNGQWLLSRELGSLCLLRLGEDSAPPDASTPIYFPRGSITRREIFTDRLLIQWTDNQVHVLRLDTATNRDDAVKLDLSAGPERCILSDDERWLAVLTEDYQLTLWNLMAGEKPQKTPLGNPSHPVHAMAFSPDSQFLASGGSRDVHVWDINRDEQPTVFQKLSGHSNYVNVLEFSFDSRRLVSGSEDHTLKVWELNTERVGSSKTLRGHEMGVHDLEFTPDGRHLISAGHDSIRMWNLDPPQDQSAFSDLRGHQSITDAKFVGKGNWLLTRDDQSLKVWQQQLDNAFVSWVMQETFRNVAADAAFVSREWIAIGHQNGAVDLRRLSESGIDDRLILQQSGESIRKVLLDPTIRFLVTLDAEGVARVFRDPTSNIVPAPLPVCSGEEFDEVHFSPGGRWFVGTTGNIVRIWDLNVDDLTGPPTWESKGGHILRIHSAAFSSDDRWLYTASTDRTAQLWDLQLPDPPTTVFTLQDHSHTTRAVRHVAFSADSIWLMTTTGRPSVRLLDLRGDSVVSRTIVVGEPNSGAPAFAFDPMSQWVAYSDDNQIRILDLASVPSEANEVVVQGHDVIKGLLSSPNGRWLVASDLRKELSVLERQSVGSSPAWKSMRVSGGPFLAFSSDSSWLNLTRSGLRNFVSVLDLSNASESFIPTQVELDLYVMASVISPDGEQLLVAYEDGQVRVYDLNIDRMVSRAKIVAGRELSELEKNQFFID